jgi:hypothetical protein
VDSTEPALTLYRLRLYECGPGVGRRCRSTSCTLGTVALSAIAASKALLSTGNYSRELVAPCGCEGGSSAAEWPALALDEVRGEAGRLTAAHEVVPGVTRNRNEPASFELSRAMQR